MKKLILFLTMFTMLYSTSILAQAKSTVINCNNLQAVIKYDQEALGTRSKCVLEREIVPGVWKKIDTKNSNGSHLIFESF